MSEASSDWRPVPGEGQVTPRRDPSGLLEADRHVARALRWTFLDVAAAPISSATLSRMGSEICCRYRCVPVVFNTRRIVLAVDDPMNAALVGCHAALLGIPSDLSLEFALTTAESLDVVLARRLERVKSSLPPRS